MIAWMALAPATALAGRDHGGRGGNHGHSWRGGDRGRDGGGHGFRGGHGSGTHHGKGEHGSRGGRHGKGGDGFKHRQGFAFFPVVTVYVPPLYYGYGYGGYGYGAPVAAPPPVYYPPAYATPPIYTVPSAYLGSAATVSVAPSEPAPRVIEYPTGRFELGGDGITAAHTRVWIPNPPAAPPDPVSASPAPPRETPRALPTSSEVTAPRLSPVYRWTDEHGVIHLTNRPDAVPREPAVQLRRAPTL
jgi:hypothetical protein